MADLGNTFKGAFIGNALDQLFAKALEALPSCSRHDEQRGDLEVYI